MGTRHISTMSPSASNGPRGLLELLKTQTPAGKEHAWNMILGGLLSLLGGDVE